MFLLDLRPSVFIMSYKLLEMYIENVTQKI